MTATFVNGIRTTSVSVDGGDQVFVEGSIQMTSGAGITGSGNTNTINVSGSVLTAAGQGIDLSGDRNIIRITESGVVSQTNVSATGTAVYVNNGADSMVVNAGEIFGSYGVYFNSTVVNGTLINTGLISSNYASTTNGAGVTSIGTGIDIDNSGSIVARGFGIDLNGGDLSVFNSGLITGSIGIQGDDEGADLTLKNTGTVRGLDGPAIELLGSGSIVNRGIIDGNVVFGASDDSYRGRGEGDVFGVVNGGGGIDTLIGSRADDSFVGGSGGDLLRGGRGDDTIKGGGGNDRVVGGRDDDILTGQAGRDTFVFHRATGEDEITDFQNGKDKIDLSAFTVSNTNQLKNKNALVSDGSGGTILDLDKIGGDGTVYIEDMGLGQWNNADFIF